MRKGFAMHEGQPPVRFVTLRISATIANEYANRCPEWLSEELDEGRRRVPLDLAQQILLDAEYNSDRRAQDVGEYGMPLSSHQRVRAINESTKWVAATSSGT